jgi:hypothetical protein
MGMTNKEIITMLEKLQEDINSFVFTDEDCEDVVRQQDVENEINERINALEVDNGNDD